MQTSKEKIITLIRNMEHITIPKYQRDYVWGLENCMQLYDDLTQIISEKKQTHFFGTIVNAPNPKTEKTDDFIIIDGAQRLTTISLLLIAFQNLIENKELNSIDDNIIYKIDKTLKNDNKEIRLTPPPNIVKEYNSLFDKRDDESPKQSQLTENLNYFTQCLKKDKEQIQADKFWDAIISLTVIVISLGKDDDAQRIFESINSTGVALSEGDKVKNFLMMSIPIKDQDDFYEDYWKEIEKNTSSNLDVFIQNFLFIKDKTSRDILISVDKTYDLFKSYASKLDKKEVVVEMLKFSEHYSWIHNPERVPNPKIQKSIESFRRLDKSKTLDVYLLQLIDTYKKGNLTDTEVENCISILENYMFRRKVCGLPTSDRIFIHLHNGIIKLEGNTEKYSERLKYLLLGKKGSDEYPRNDIFLEKLRTRDIFKPRNDLWKDYLLEELENFDNKERIDIASLKKNRSCSKEHIMPQKLNKDWIEDLGGEEEANRVWTLWLYRLGNVTLTAYNSSYSNNSFTKKLTMTHGFKDSRFSLNKFIAECDKWTETEMERRTEHLIEIAKKRWPEITTSFKEYNE